MIMKHIQYKFLSKWKATMGEFSKWRRLLMFVLFHMPLTYCVGMNGLNGWADRRFMPSYVHRCIKEWSTLPPLHVPYSLQQQLLLIQYEKSLVGGADACKRRHKKQLKQPPNILFGTVCLHTGALTPQHTQNMAWHMCYMWQLWIRK